MAVFGFKVWPVECASVLASTFAILIFFWILIRREKRFQRNFLKRSMNYWTMSFSKSMYALQVSLFAKLKLPRRILHHLIMEVQIHPVFVPYPYVLINLLGSQNVDTFWKNGHLVTTCSRTTSNTNQCQCDITNYRHLTLAAIPESRFLNILVYVIAWNSTIDFKTEKCPHISAVESWDVINSMCVNFGIGKWNKHSMHCKMQFGPEKHV